MKMLNSLVGGIPSVLANIATCENSVNMGSVLSQVKKCSFTNAGTAGELPGVKINKGGKQNLLPSMVYKITGRK